MKVFPHPERFAAVILLVAVLSAAGWGVWQRHLGGPGASLSFLPPPPPSHLLTFTAASAEELVQVLDVAWSAPRPAGSIPNLAPDSFPEGMNELPVAAKKQVFFRSVAPHLVAANQWIAYERDYLLGFLAEAGGLEGLDAPKRACLVGLADRYRVPLGEGELDRDAMLKVRRRVDKIPLGLALAQAAIESGWGGSRFARKGNNLFGQWVFSGDKGIVPKERPEGATYAIARFDDLGQSVRAYLRNLNTLWAYADLRQLRARMRAEGRSLGSLALAGGLLMYSERREEYVEDVRKMIRSNRLQEFDGLVLEPRPAKEWKAELAAAEHDVRLRPASLLAPAGASVSVVGSSGVASAEQLPAR